MQDDKTSYEILRRLSDVQSFHCFGYAKIFSDRVRDYGNWLRYISILGILTPALVGTYILTWGLNMFLQWIIFAAGIVGVIQFIFSIFALTGKWDDKLSYAIEASKEYSNLQQKLKTLSILPPEKLTEFKDQYESLVKECTNRGQQDISHSIAEWEERKGMRAALRQYQWTCEGCGKKALSLQSIDCDVCGKFSIIYQYKLLRLWTKKSKA